MVSLSVAIPAKGNQGCYSRSTLLQLVWILVSELSPFAVGGVEEFAADGNDRGSRPVDSGIGGVRVRSRGCSSQRINIFTGSRQDSLGGAWLPFVSLQRFGLDFLQLAALAGQGYQSVVRSEIRENG